jgi:UDP-4-keto-D-FucNAc 4-reductase
VSLPASRLPTRVAVTGASGFVGRYLVERLIREGSSVVAISRTRSTCAGAESIVVPDYRDTQSLVRAFGHVDAVFHLAARAHQRDAGDTDASYREANVEATANVARACGRAGVRRLVFVSSIGVNGNRSSRGPFTESDTPAPVEAYAVSKLAAERAVAEQLAAGPTDYVILRPPLVYGPGCPGNFRTLLNLVARAPIVPLGALEAPRTFIYIESLLAALLVAAIHPAASRRTFVVADDRDVSVAEVARTVASELGRSARVVWNVEPRWLAWAARLAGRASAYDKLTAPLQVDASAFSAATGWVPSFSPQEGLRATARQWRPGDSPV